MSKSKKTKNDFPKCNVMKNLNKSKYPIDINLAKCKKMMCYPLRCSYFHHEATKLKMVNTGSTVLIRGSWPADRPCLEDGPLTDKYIFSHLHFHWGKNSMTGGNHTVDGERQAMEMHVVYFKKQYIYPEVAINKEDGELIVVYIMKLFPNHRLDVIIDRLKEIKVSGSECYITPVALTSFMPIFENDFLLYRADVRGYPATCIVSRRPIAISESQVKSFQLVQNQSERMIENYEAVCYPPVPKLVWYVNPSPSQIATLLRAE